MEYRASELAKKASTTVRNIRAYQERGLLPPPRREGRLAFYDEAHLARLRVVATLLERGYSMANIGELLSTWEKGTDLRDLLGLESALTSPFSDEQPTTITLAELTELFGVTDPSTFASAVEIGLVTFDHGEVRAPSMRMLRVGAELSRAGIPLSALLAEFSALRNSVDGIAKRFVALVGKFVFDSYSSETRGDSKNLAQFVTRVRPMAELVVDTMLAQALEKQVREELGERLARGLHRHAAQSDPSSEKQNGKSGKSRKSTQREKPEKKKKRHKKRDS